MGNLTDAPQRNLPPGMLPLGFGCAGLLRDGVDRATSLRLIETALDCGVRYFDTARMYGGGHAEALLGSLMPSRRRQIVIATKAGIVPADRSIPVRVLNRGVRLLHRLAPALKDRIKTPAAINQRTGMFEVRHVRKSVDASLRKLKTDYLDILLLHECSEADLRNGEVLGLLQRLQNQGKIRGFGIATGIDETLRITDSNPELSRIVQISSNIWNMNIRRLPPKDHGLTITHSTLSSRFHELTKRLSRDQEAAARWASALQIDPLDQPALGQLLLAYAFHLNAGGVVIFSSSSAANIKASVAVAQQPQITAGQIEGFDALIKEKDRMLTLKGTHRDYLTVA